MSIEQVIPGVYAIPLGGVNAFLVDSDELILVDTGMPQKRKMPRTVTWNMNYLNTASDG